MDVQEEKLWMFEFGIFGVVFYLCFEPDVEGMAERSTHFVNFFNTVQYLDASNVHLIRSIVTSYRKMVESL